MMIAFFEMISQVIWIPLYYLCQMSHIIWCLQKIPSLCARRNNGIIHKSYHTKCRQRTNSTDRDWQFLLLDTTHSIHFNVRFQLDKKT